MMPILHEIGGVVSSRSVKMTRLGMFAGGNKEISDNCVSAQSLARHNSSSIAEYEAAADALMKVLFFGNLNSSHAFAGTLNALGPFQLCLQHIPADVPKSQAPKSLPRSVLQVLMGNMQVGDTRAALKLLSRHHCWQKLWNTSHSLHVSKDPALIHELTADLRQAGQSELAIQILSDLGETEVSQSTTISPTHASASPIMAVCRFLMQHLLLTTMAKLQQCLLLEKIMMPGFLYDDGVQMAGKFLVEAERWDEAFEVLSKSPGAVGCVLDAYIPWLLKQHRAQDAYRALRYLES